MDILQRMPWMAQNAVFQRLSEIAEVASLNKEERQKYDESLRAYRDTIAVMDGQYLQGMEQGMEKGRAEGEAIGAQKNATKNARNMKAKGYAIEDIADITGLSREEIAEL